MDIQVMDDKYQNAIIRYESARQLVSSISKERNDLISKCEMLSTSEDSHGVLVETGVLCLRSAHDLLTETLNENHGEYYTYEEIIDEMHADDTCCDHCHKSYKIKIGPLADARKEFGNAKRALSNIGKKLIKGGCNAE